jgi:hypothetical protein
MNEERILQTLAGAARADGPPPVDVADGVLASLRVRRAPSRLIVWFATAVSAAAMVVAVLAARAMMTPGAAGPVMTDLGVIGML